MSTNSELAKMPPALRRALGKKAGADLAQQWDRVRDLAYREWVAWLSGSRHDSIAALERERIIAIFEVRKEVPTIQRLVEEFGISEGRAASMMSRMRYSSGRRIRALQLEQLADYIHKSVGTKSGNADVTVPMSPSRTRAYDSFLREGVEEDESKGVLMAPEFRDANGTRWKATADEWLAIEETLRQSAGDERTLAG